MNPRLRSLCSASALALLATACLQDPVEPEIIIDPLEPAAFEAVSANGGPLPAVITADGAGAPARTLTRASLLLIAPDSLRLILLTQPAAEDGTPGAVVRDTLRARLGPPDSVIVLSPMGTYPLRLHERMTFGVDGTLVLTVDQPLPSSSGAAATRPLELQFRAVAYDGSDQS